MRTTIELPDDLLARAKSNAALNRKSLKEFFIEAVEQKLHPSARTRQPLPILGDPTGPVIHDLTSEQIDEALFGSADPRA